MHCTDSASELRLAIRTTSKIANILMKTPSSTDPTSKNAATIPGNEQWFHHPEMKQ
jgi:hypothetical protein